MPEVRGQKLLQMAKVALQKLLHILLVMPETRFQKMEPLFAASRMILLATARVALTKLERFSHDHLPIFEGTCEAHLQIFEGTCEAHLQIF